MQTAELRRTCLHDVHLALGAQMGPFGGFDMPIRYDGIVAEHRACREGAVLFDTCHMGEFLISGDHAVADLDGLISCPIASMQTGQCRYGLLCNPTGGVIDDLLVYRLDDTTFMLVVNAGTQSDDADWIANHLSCSTTFVNRSSDTAKIDLQGPNAPGIAQSLLGHAVDGLKYFRFVQTVYGGEPVLLSRTGYTGEVGFELYAAPDQALMFWHAAMALGAQPAGLGARDTLRLEAGLPLYGHELTADRNAGESGYDWAISRDKAFVGSDVVCDRSKRQQKLVGIRMEGRRAARAGDVLCDTAGTDVGVVTSGSFGPSVGVSIALGYIDAPLAAEETAVQVRQTRGELAGQVTRLPFWTRGTVRQTLNTFLNSEVRKEGVDDE